ncbi:sugar kinase [Lentilactobacillus otakiensis]|uniref:PfkB domain-containing protein n=1 Tax=Lentilactobacillus otakiensis DSM 19908 = JCM 15040 TaxID=1423780 RepID=S4NR71_9LACO|nr:sugar kinase [Lentilactobacillus otakiensis]KRL10101.1 PfkB domain-containing protein [Lentilactobacillus otakiensis DSM 19908 = JCM 15040]MBZ3776357.1 sugar kinase [Lentilactobacillus otakiensis]MDV3517952.1 sugar kinase [Lentilactobacillus otakiensis]GAD16488.1 pfkB domain-containing protein [Lentilactobacillus otakiensis DSM 19908 = JCM 15040]
MQVTTFGEIMLRLTVPGNQKFVQTDWFHANYGGAEANVAVSLALLGDQATFITKLPNNILGDTVIQKLNEFGVDTNRIVRGGKRLGLYFLQPGAGVRSSKVIYDRNDSAFAASKDGDYHWDELLDGTDYFYISGITPALSEELQATLLSAVKFCQDHSIKVIYDANFRGKLWTADEANTFNSKILPFVDICLVNDEDLENAFGLKAFDNRNHQAIHEKDSFKQSLEELTTNYPNIKLVASILRNIYSAQKSDWQAILLTDHKFYESSTYNMQVVPEVAAGDAFGAAIVHGVLNNFKPQFQVDYAIAAATLKLTIPGDFNLSRDSEIRDAMTR